MLAGNIRAGHYIYLKFNTARSVPVDETFMEPPTSIMLGAFTDQECLAKLHPAEATRSA